MTLYKLEEQAKLRREKIKEAISLAMESRWEEAAALNRFLVQLFPDDVEAYNRLGKALSELGNYAEAQQAFTKALALSPSNSIARRNLERLAHLKDSPRQPKQARKLTPHLFIEESGKTGVTVLQNEAGPDVLARLSAGDPMHLTVSGTTMAVEDGHGEHLGTVEPRLAVRLIRLMKGGNRYEAAVTSVSGSQVAILIREVYRDPGQRGVASFPSKESYRSPFSAEPLYYDLDEEEEEEIERDIPVSRSNEDEDEELAVQQLSNERTNGEEQDHHKEDEAIE